MTVTDITVLLTQASEGADHQEIQMRVFVTGASGHIGSPVVRELLGAGHRVIGLARSAQSAAAITAAGAEALRGDLDDTDLLREAAAAATRSSTSPSSTRPCNRVTTAAPSPRTR